MSHISCPMCGKNCPVSRFDPNSLDSDIYLQQAHGLGRAAGFSFENLGSTLGDDTFTPQICERCFSLIQLFLENDIISKEDLVNRFDLKNEIIKDEYISKSEYFESIYKIENQYKETIRKITQENNDNIRKHTDLLQKYDRFIMINNRKILVENILKRIYNSMIENSAITFVNKDWGIYLKEINPKGYNTIIREFYRIDYEIRIKVRKRIVTKNNKIKELLDFMMKEPVIKDITDVITKKPDQTYFDVHLNRAKSHF